MSYVILKCCLLLFYATMMNHFSIGLWCAMKRGFYVTTSDDHLSGWTEKKLQSSSRGQTCTQKRSWSLFSGLLPVWPTIASWILVKLLYLRNMLSKWMKCTENWNTYWPHWSTGPNSPWQCPTVCHKTNTSKVEQIGLWNVALSAIFTCPPINQLPRHQAS